MTTATKKSSAVKHGRTVMVSMGTLFIGYAIGTAIGDATNGLVLVLGLVSGAVSIVIGASLSND
jgi:hypothetical protein